MSDATPPSDDQGHAEPTGPSPSRKRRGSRPRDRDWMGAATVAPQTSAALPRFLLIALAGVAAILGVGALLREGPSPADAFMTNAAVPVEGGKDPQRAFAEGLFGPEFFAAENATDFAEEPGWQKALQVMGGLEPAFVTEHLDFSLNLHYEEVLAHPEKYRGRFVRIRGIVLPEFSAKKLGQPVAGRGDWYRGRICDPDGDSTKTYFDLLDPPPPFATRDEAMDVDGVFYRTVRYETQAGKFVEVPWVIARTVVPRNRDPKTSGTVHAIGLFLAFLALVGSIVYLVRGGRRRKADASGAPQSIRALFDQKSREGRSPSSPDPPGPSV